LSHLPHVRMFIPDTVSFQVYHSDSPQNIEFVVPPKKSHRPKNHKTPVYVPSGSTGYGPEQEYGVPQKEYGAPPPQKEYGAPPSKDHDASPQKEYGAPQKEYGAPPPQGEYGAPPSNEYGAPQPQQDHGLSTPQEYGAPQQYGGHQPHQGNGFIKITPIAQGDHSAPQPQVHYGSFQSRPPSGPKHDAPHGGRPNHRRPHQGGGHSSEEPCCSGPWRPVSSKHRG